jgi:tRNA pseudouridine38-40 synthase
VSAPGTSAAPAALRVRLDLAYDGTDFHGWADQPGLRTVEGELTSALATAARAPVRLTVAGRTDAGVHARHQVAHADLPAEAWEGPDRGGPRRPPGEALVRRVNGILAQRHRQRAGGRGPGTACDLVIHRAARVSADFDARFSALGRHYSYRLCDEVRERDPLRRHDVLWLPGGPLDLDAMNGAAEALLGEHDFLAYCRPREGATTIRTLRELRVWRGTGSPEGEAGAPVVVRVSADAFCHSMVRSLVGALIEVGRGRRSAAWPGELLEARSRTRAAPIAPARGLTLEGVDYPDEDQWAARAGLARHRRDQEEQCRGCGG